MKFLTFVLVWSSCCSLSAAGLDRPVRIQIGVDPGSLDPNHIESLVGTSIAYNLYQTLVRLDENGKVVPGLAEKYEMSKNGRIYKFKMRADAKWSDGKPVTIDDCIFGLLDPLDPKTAADDASLLFAIKGAPEFYRGKGSRDAVAVKRVGDWCQVELSEPQSGFLGNLTLALTSPKRADQKGHFPGPTTGHYVIQSMTASEIKLAPNPEYHESGQLS
ncbi:MAG: ABC transporter substrate-binding protein, partial [Bdellovibrionales bacterium]